LECDRNRRGVNDIITPLYGAAALGRLAIAKLLVDADADVNLVGDGTITPLGAAARYDKPALVRFLIKAGASIHQEPS
jgi:ankyrin repeat protein